MIKLIDSHCHLNYFKDDLDQVMNRAKDASVFKTITICTKVPDISEIISISNSYENCFFSVGIHPSEAHETYNSEVLFTKNAVGIGETGLDYFYSKDSKEAQIKSFNIHIEASIKQRLPLIVHTRDADEDTLSCLKEQSGAFGVIHCFTGSKEMAKKCLDLGFYISFSGIITFKNVIDLHEVVKYVPNDKILIETDSPYLAPVPFRGKRNEPSYLKEIAIKVAALKDQSFEDIANLTTANCEKLFKI